MEYILNELSLEAQFETMKDFLDSLRDSTIKVLVLAVKEKGTIYKSRNLSLQKVTETQTFYEILKERNDEARKMKSILLSKAFQDPYWEDTRAHSSEHFYFLSGKVVTDTSVAEAYERSIPLISFQNSRLSSVLLVKNEENIEKSIFNFMDLLNFEKFISELYKEDNPLEYCKLRYRETNLCFDEFEVNFGFKQLEKCEIDLVLGAFDKFVEYSWDEIIKGNKPFYYKKYQPPSAKVDWFTGSNFEEKTIDKFRLSYTHRIALRCYGYRKGNKFYALRIEKNHNISDNG